VNIKVIIATHKKYWMPSDSMYLPLHVGRENKDDIGYIGDNTGDNISLKNPNYCELTGMYWAWKNLEADYIGLVHYRRHFTDNSLIQQKLYGKKKCILNLEKTQEILKFYDVILPNKRHYYIETIKSHYEHTPWTYAKDLEILRKAIEKLYPEYLSYYDMVLSRTWAHMFNMFIMKKELLNQYCQWLFSILFEVEKNIDITEYTTMEARVYGFLSEFLLDVWIEKNNINYKELPVMFMENQNWFIKGARFIKRKFSKKIK